MESDVIKRYMISADGDRIEHEDGIFCDFGDVERLVNSITEQRDTHHQDLEHLKDENALIADYHRAVSRLIAHDIMQVLNSVPHSATILISGPHLDRLLNFVKRMGLHD